MEELRRNTALLVSMDYRQVPMEVYLRWMEELEKGAGKYAELKALNTTEQ